jgi:hypothetical protein|nr:hypothetical protein RAR13_24355 [Aminobacter aminovorans]
MRDKARNASIHRGRQRTPATTPIHVALVDDRQRRGQNIPRQQAFLLFGGLAQAGGVAVSTAASRPIAEKLRMRLATAYVGQIGNSTRDHGARAALAVKF